MREVYVFRMRTSCPECGEPVGIDGPSLEIECHACRSTLAMTAGDWHKVFDRRNFVQPQLSEGETCAWSLRSAELDVTIRFGPQSPLCASCGARMDLSMCAPEMDGKLFCVKCGAPMSTFPAPEWLRAEDRKIRQVFGVTPKAAGTAQVEVRDAAKPVSLSCPDCGGHLKISGDSARVVTCTYCKADLFVPDALWRAVHPVKKRGAWYVGFG
jgi:ribosomal protein S27E